MANTTKNIKVLERFPEINYTLIYWEGKSYQPIVACWHFNDTDPNDVYWSQGHYFDSVQDAIHYIDSVQAERR